MKSRLLFIVLPLLALVSCQQEETEYIQDSPEKGQEIRITAGFGDADPSTRTSISSNGKVLWSPGEAINIFYGPSGESSGSKFVSQNTEAVSTAVFTGTITAFTGVSEGGEPLSFWGIYPYSESNRCDGSSVVLELPVVQNAVEENFADNTVPMVAQAPGLALPFYNICSMIRFSLVNSDITKVTVRGNNGETVAGRVSVSMGSDGKPVWSDTDGEGSKSITLNGPSGGAFEAGKFYYIAILPGEFPNGYTMEFYTSDGRYGERVRGSAITFNRNESTKQSSRDQGVTFTPLYVDMGGGILWAAMNVGANSPEEFGDFFAWGETSAKDDYSWSTYSYGTENNITKYNSTDGLTTLEPGDDAATVNWGGEWRTPTIEEWNWLIDNCTWVWKTTSDGYANNGYLVTADNGNTIFLPAAGSVIGTSPDHPGSNGYYWSSSLSENVSDSRSAQIIQFASNFKGQPIDDLRYYGESVRPVKGISAPSPEYVELGPDVKWATMNVGASSPEESGDYFAWGETAPKSNYVWSTYEWGNSASDMNYFTQSGYGNALGADTDAATANWGGDWRTPTKYEWDWLRSNCTWTWTTQNDVNGFLVTSNVSGYEGNSIFLPAAGYASGTGVKDSGSMGYYMASFAASASSSRGYNFSSSGRYVAEHSVYEGHTLRPVYMPRVPITSMTLESFEMVEGTQKTLRPVIEPENTTQGVVWTVTNFPAALTIDVSGMARAIAVHDNIRVMLSSAPSGVVAEGYVNVLPRYVDMGGGMDWATINVGAIAPTDYGNYYAWGETNVKTDYSSATYNASSFIDVATDKWGGQWTVPSDADWQWLIDNCTWEWTSDYNGSGVAGEIVTSKQTGKSIFLPAAGNRNGKDRYDAGSNGYYWSSSLSDVTDCAKNLFVSSSNDSPLIDYFSRCSGLSVRPVRRQWVDMGDGLKWATTNVGGYNPEDCGDYFAWGENNAKTDYSWTTYKWGTSETSLTRYVTDESYGMVDGKTTFADYAYADDAARANWGATWRTPTMEEWTWLHDNCTWQKAYKTENDTEVFIGYNVIASNGNSLFLPAAGWFSGTGKSLEGVAGLYWSSTLYDDNRIAWSVYFRTNYTTVLIYRNDSFRRSGYTIRPVSD